jgi:hypothetical protein
MESTIWNDIAIWMELKWLNFVTWMKQYHVDEFEDINGFDCMDGARTCG